jgi:hypothetical protein
MRRITQMSKPRFMELCAEWADGSLIDKWNDLQEAKTKAEKVEERQIRAIAMLIQEAPEEYRRLLREDWKLFEVLVDENEILRFRAHK